MGTEAEKREYLGKKGSEQKGREREAQKGSGEHAYRLRPQS